MASPRQRRWPIPNEVRLNVTFLIAAHHVRVQARRNALNETMAIFQRYIDGSSDEVDLNIPLIHADIILPQLPSIAAEMCERSWTSVDFKRRTLAVSDTPVTPLKDDTCDERTAAGLRSPCGILAPLARRTALVIDPSEEEPREDRWYRANTRISKAAVMAAGVRHLRWRPTRFGTARPVPKG
ncbi:hypothetical protein [Streptomyces sp. 7-21]|uniref:hypothetical protein n=1 Tax=Streptomyces sp. 7-21 TaxID=2802283 RepID=UPI0035A866CA